MLSRTQYVEKPWKQIFVFSFNLTEMYFYRVSWTYSLSSRTIAWRRIYRNQWCPPKQKRVSRSHHWLKPAFVACSGPSHYTSRYIHILYNFQWISNQTVYIKIYFKMSSTKCRPFCYGTFSHQITLLCVITLWHLFDCWYLSQNNLSGIWSAKYLVTYFYTRFVSCFIAFNLVYVLCNTYIMTYETIPYSVHKSNNIVIDLKIVISYLKRFNWTTFSETLELNIVVADCEYSL